jgi:hypothetical protein
MAKSAPLATTCTAHRSGTSAFVVVRVDVTVLDASRLVPDEDCHVDTWEKLLNLLGVVAYVGSSSPPASGFFPRSIKWTLITILKVSIE